MSRSRRAMLSLPLLAIAACGEIRESTAPGEAAGRPARGDSTATASRAGIVIAGSGGLAGIERVTALDSAGGTFVTVLRRQCGGSRCAPLDSASGTVDGAEVRRIFELVEREQVFALRPSYGSCPGCGDQVRFTTTVRANGRRAVIVSDGETTPAVLGRVHVALAEAIRAARGAP